jgi:DNA-directed RNA polymerase specialized sigma24 family protein
LNYNTELVKNLRDNYRPGSALTNAELHARALANDQAAREELVGGNASLVITIVNRYLSTNPQHEHLQDELVGDALLALVVAIYTATSPIRNVTGYFSHVIQHSILATVIAAPTIRACRGAKYAVPEVTNTYPDEAVSRSEQSTHDMRELIDACCDTEQDRQIVALREVAHTYDAIVVLTGLARGTIERRIHTIRDRVYKCLREST